MTRLLLVAGAAVMAAPALAQTAADDYYDPEEMAAARKQLYAGHGAQINSLILAEQFEWLNNDDDALAWEAQAWVGGDINKFWFKTEGEYSTDESTFEAAEWQFLYSRAIHAFWDIQAGIRLDPEPGPARQYGVVSLQGLAPYWFEIDAALFLSDRGDLSARLEAEYELRLTQRLILQPKIELDLAASDDVATGVFSGLNTLEAGVRLRYEIRREFAPYIGVLHESALGDARDAVKAAGGDASDTMLIAGLRFWY
ncbi:MAG: copper resistance protein B [Pseudomonadota bacterium]